MSTYYASENDVRKRVEIYFAPDEKAKLQLWARRVRRRPRSAAVREAIMRLVDTELERYEMHEAITTLVAAELEES